uniref:Uncharacterized protein n=1 Tax=Cacopsylla melanoneura TaxID=428564 RepID=A0A8D8TX88_9HEMI
MSENRPYLNCSVFSEIIIKITNFFMVRSPATGTFFAKNAEWSKVFDIISTPFFAKRSLRAPASYIMRITRSSRNGPNGWFHLSCFTTKVGFKCDFSAPSLVSSICHCPPH